MLRMENLPIDHVIVSSSKGFVASGTDIFVLLQILGLGEASDEEDATLPCGIANRGNTCFFAVVMQSLFHIPSFRSAILSFDECTECSDAGALRATAELRRLFVEMTESPNYSRRPLWTSMTF